MRRSIMAMAIAASMEAMQRTPTSIATAGHRVSAGGGNFNRRQAKNKSYRPRGASKYTSHQSKQECARRLRVGSAAHHASKVML